MTFAPLVFALLPYIVPYSLTIQQAAAPHASLAFLFYGAGLVIYPITLIYTGVVYWIFRGRVDLSDDDKGASEPRPLAALDKEMRQSPDARRSGMPGLDFVPMKSQTASAAGLVRLFGSPWELFL